MTAPAATRAPIVRRVDTARGHHYVDAQGKRVPGVTTIINGGLPKPALINWAASATADYAVNNWERLSAMPPAARLKELTGARYAERDAAANRGTQVHKFAETLIHGGEVEVPDELAPYVEAYAGWLDEHDVTPVLTEFGIYEPSDPFAGTADLLADITIREYGLPPRRVRALLDLKTSRSGVFGETALQLAAYGHASYWLGAPDDVQATPVEFTGAIHIQPGGATLVPVTAGLAEFEAFRNVQRVARWLDGSRDLIGTGMPGEAPRYRLTAVTS